MKSGVELTRPFLAKKRIGYRHEPARRNCSARRPLSARRPAVRQKTRRSHNPASAVQWIPSVWTLMEVNPSTDIAVVILGGLRRRSFSVGLHRHTRVHS